MDWDFNVKNNSENGLTMAAIIILAIVGFVIAPIFTLLAINTLFPVLAIPYTFGTWLATFFLIAVFRGKVNNK